MAEQDEQRTQIGQVKPQILEEEMKKSYLDYAMSVIVARALPDVRDGLKPVHRRILYGMHQMGLRHTAKFRKSAAIVGDVLGKYHPHGDLAVYESLVRLAQDFSMRYPLVWGQGNFGSMDGDSAAAPRYTEAKMAVVASEMLADIEKDTVDFMPNYDGTQMEPVVLPSRIPNLLVNGTLGIAVGMATNIPPHNLSEVLDATAHLIDNPEATIEDLMKFIQGPDFPTGATIYGAEGIRNIYSPQGRGSVTIRAVSEVVEGKKNDMQIIVSEIPYAVNKSTLIARMAELVKEKKIVGISDIRDESDKDGVRIVIDLKRDAYAKKILNQLYKLTAMQTVFHANMVALVDGIQPRTLSLKNILEEFIEHRRRVVIRRTEFELKRAREREHILEGLKKALDNIDKVIATIKKSKDKEFAKSALMKNFKLSDLQAAAILEMRLSTLAALERKKIEDELKTVRDTIKGLEELLKNAKKRDEVIKSELAEIKDRFGDERRTKIIKHEVGKFSDEDLIPNEDVIVTITKGGYVKRTNANIYRAQGRGGKGVVGMGTKEEDVVEHLTFARNHDYILFFTNEGRVFQAKVYEIPPASRLAKGQAIQNFIQVAPDEKITSLNVLPDFEQGAFLIMATRKGTIKKTPIKQFENVRKVGIRAIGLDKGDELKWVQETGGKDDVIMATKLGQALRTHEAEIRPMGRGARGVRGIKLRANDELVGMDIVKPDAEMLVITENGFGKRTELSQFDVHHRGGVGIRAGKVTEKTGSIVDVRIVTDVKGDLIIVSKKGQIIRLSMAHVSKIGRDTQGVRVMRLADGDKVASVASVEKEEPEETAAASSTPEQTETPQEAETPADEPPVIASRQPEEKQSKMPKKKIAAASPRNDKKKKPAPKSKPKKPKKK